ncbi:hypothetical protein D3C77_553630 [compost metagenome]
MLISDFIKDRGVWAVAILIRHALRVETEVYYPHTRRPGVFQLQVQLAHHVDEALWEVVREFLFILCEKVIVEEHARILLNRLGRVERRAINQQASDEGPMIPIYIRLPHVIH